MGWVEVERASSLTCANIDSVKGGQVGGEVAGGRLGWQGGISLVFNLHDRCRRCTVLWWVVGRKFQTGGCCGVERTVEDDVFDGVPDR